jgi:hypothetical protein
MGIINWLFGKTDEVHTPPPLDRAPSDPVNRSQRQEPASLTGAPHQPLSRTQIEKLASVHGVSAGAIATLAEALGRSQGRAAQFSHAELGGMGQWMSGGMLMIGDMFNHELKAKVDRVCRDVAAAIADASRDGSVGRARSGADQISWWPPDFGTPAAAGSQNAMRYAFFPATKRLAIDDNGTVSFYDTGEHYLTGVSQQQSTTQTLAFSNTDGRPVPLSCLRRVPSVGG